MKFRPGNAQILGSRDEQQDAFAFSDVDDTQFVGHGGVLAVVADGMGGLEGGRSASLAAVRAFLASYCAKQPSETVEDALRRAIDRANDAVLSVRHDGSAAAEGSGTTLAAAVLHAEGLSWVAAGDSRVYLLRHRQLVQVTVDHTYARELDAKVALGALSLRAAAEDPERDALVSYLGQAAPAHIDSSVTALPLEDDDTVIVCSDGLYKALTEDEIVAVARGATDPQRLCEQLSEAVQAKRLPHQDNCTVLAVSSRLVSERRSGALLSLSGPEPRPVTMWRTSLAWILAIVVSIALAWLGWRWWTSPEPTPAAGRVGLVLQKGWTAW